MRPVQLFSRVTTPELPVDKIEHVKPVPTQMTDAEIDAAFAPLKYLNMQERAYRKEYDKEYGDSDEDAADLEQQRKHELIERGIVRRF